MVASCRFVDAFTRLNENQNQADALRSEDVAHHSSVFAGFISFVSTKAFRMSLFPSFLRSLGSSRRVKSRSSRPRLQVEALETRNLLASVLTYHNDLASTGVNA